jgi:hypothetical protein
MSDLVKSPEYLGLEEWTWAFPGDHEEFLPREGWGKKRFQRRGGWEPNWTLIKPISLNQKLAHSSWKSDSCLQYILSITRRCRNNLVWTH